MNFYASEIITSKFDLLLTFFFYFKKLDTFRRRGYVKHNYSCLFACVLNIIKIGVHIKTIMSLKDLNKSNCASRHFLLICVFVMLSCLQPALSTCQPESVDSFPNLDLNQFSGVWYDYYHHYGSATGVRMTSLVLNFELQADDSMLVAFTGHRC